MKKKQVIASWSGGKDSCFACYKALTWGMEVTHILNCASLEYKRASAHGIKIELIALQAQAMAVNLHQNLVTKDNYEKEFKAAVEKFKKMGLRDIITGDIHLEDSRAWMNRICRETGANPIMPLWGMKPKDILEDFIAAGFEAFVVCAKAEFFDREWLGRKIDRDFVKDLSERKPEVDLCGEKGEFHTFVVNGPVFKKKIEVSLGEKVLRNGYWFLDLEAKT